MTTTTETIDLWNTNNLALIGPSDIKLLGFNSIDGGSNG
jgi:hypothetical protein